MGVLSVLAGLRCGWSVQSVFKIFFQFQLYLVGGLILEQKPSDKMAETTERKDNLEYIWKKDLPPNYYPKLQILTAQEIIDGNTFNTPHTMMNIKNYRNTNPSMFRIKSSF